jgi:hypothetical protein
MGQGLSPVDSLEELAPLAIEYEEAEDTFNATLG